MEPLKKAQVEGFLMYAEPEVLFGNLDELCSVSNVFLFIVHNGNLKFYSNILYFQGFILHNIFLAQNRLHIPSAKSFFV
jgi:hypothetical protein